MLNIVLFGPPGAGKGTQSVMLQENYQLKHISTGDLFRFHLSQNTDLGKLAASYSSKGQLVPDEVTINMLKEEIQKYPDAKGFIFDGFPRTTPQAEALDNLLTSMDTGVSVMLALEVPEEELKQRLQERAKTSGRADDADPVVIQNRIDTYNRETKPVKDFYAAQSKLQEIDGLGSIESITDRLFKAIDSL